MNVIARPEVLMDERYFKAFSPVPNNYNIEEILPYFKVAERIWIEPILGTALYEELIEQVNDNKLTDLNSTLLMEVYPLEAYAITYESLPFLSYHISEVGITKGKSDNSDSVSINDVNYINSHLRSQVEVLKSELKKWLNDHADAYPLYKPDDCQCNDDDSCDCGWINEYLGDKPYRCYPNANKPNTRLQAWSLPRRKIDIG